MMLPVEAALRSLLLVEGAGAALAAGRMYTVIVRITNHTRAPHPNPHPATTTRGRHINASDYN